MEKVEGPTTSLTLLGILLDTVRMEACLPEDKLIRIKDLIQKWLNKKKVSLVGLLQHAAKLVRPSRSFVRRMFLTATRVPELEFYVRLNADFHSDLLCWHSFLAGQFFSQVADMDQPENVVVRSDASDGWG